MIMKTGMSATLNHRMPESRRHLQIAARPAQALLPQGGDAVGFLCPDDGIAVEYDAVTGKLRLEGRVGVFGERAGVDRAADRGQVLAAVQLCAARHAGEHADDILGASGGGLGRDVFEGDEACEQVARLTAFLHVGRDAAHCRVRQVARHAPQGQRLEQNIGIHDLDRFGPALGMNGAKAMVKRVRLALTADLPAQMEYRAGILHHLLAHDGRRVIGAGVVDEVNAPGARRIGQAHQRIDA
jgi:hypothetical protein